MYELDLVQLRKVLCKGVRIVVAVRMLAKDIDRDTVELGNMEREIREAAGAVQKAEGLLEKGECVVLKRT
ncbi:hypothetical protein ES703_106234 [subsurface metagenome]